VAEDTNYWQLLAHYFMELALPGLRRLTT